jgi:hypothetical protein
MRFLSDWSHEQDGDIRAGEPLSIEYAKARLPRCRSTYYGMDNWSIVAYMRFHPDGEERSARVEYGLTVEVPIDATKIELWFKNADPTGCVAWDSRYGQNYWFDVTPA